MLTGTPRPPQCVNELLRGQKDAAGCMAAGIVEALTQNLQVLPFLRPLQANAPRPPRSCEFHASNSHRRALDRVSERGRRLPLPRRSRRRQPSNHFWSLRLRPARR